MPDSLKIWGTDYIGVKGFKASAQLDGPAGKNLYNSLTKTDGYYLDGSGVPTSENTCSYSDYISVIPGENYVWSGISSKTGSNNKRAIGYNTSKSYVQVVNNVSVSGSDIPYENSFTVPSGVEYIRISFNTADSEMMVEHGATKTSYEPYTNLATHAYFRPQGAKSISQNGTGIDVAEYATVDVNVSGGGGSPTLQTKTKSYTPTESQQTEAVAADSGYDGLDTVNITVGAISSSYVGTGITRRSSSDLTASGATVSVPSGYYESSASKSVTSGTEGTPTATKGSVSNHSISITPSVTNVSGYIAGGTKTGTAVTVSALELVSGSVTQSSNGTYDVTNLSSLVVAVPIVTYYTGSSVPSASLGSNGDIYLQTS